MGYTITVVIAAGTITSGISVADANALALAEAQAQAEALRLLTPCVSPESFCNEEQTYTDTCPEGMIGDPITATIAACAVESAISIEEANALALAMAVAEAEAERLLSPCLVPVEPGDVTFFSREHGGEWSLIGYPEFVDPSTPPKKYLVRTYSGTGTSERCSISGMCVDGHCAEGVEGQYDTCTPTGYCAYDAVTAVLTTTTETYCTWEDAVVSSNFCHNIAPACGYILNETQTSQSTTLVKECCFETAFAGYEIHEADYHLDLSVEDTVANAIVRLVNSLPPLGVFTECAAFPCGVGLLSVQDPVGFTGDLMRGEFEVVGTVFSASTDYIATISFIRTDLATLETDTFSMNYPVSSLPDGSLDLIIDMPEESGFEINVSGAPSWSLA